MIKTLEIDGRIVTVYPKKIEINGNEVIAPGKVVVELLPANEIYTPSQELNRQIASSLNEKVEVSG
ncbi:hypothetical protein [Methylophilus methylotrophus]|uniref:hypothetical protein n=1 Tax=Methylophilus methylotrophus TaxID=17 RepID=UPI00036E6BC1|nr:hypothetical protein [Methylophilus methylotrophus]